MTNSSAAGPGSGIPSGAIVAENLNDFGSVDNSLVFPRGAGPEVTNITQIAPRTFNFYLRHRGNPWSPLNPEGTRGAWYDGDRNLEWNEGKRDRKYHDKSRAEVAYLKGYGTKKGPQMKIGETWDIATTVRLDPSFRPSRGYCNIMQPVFDQSFVTLKSMSGDVVTAELGVMPRGIGGGVQTARTFTIKKGEWTRIVVRIKFANDGFYQCSVNGDAFRGINLDTAREGAVNQNKWGLYMTGTWDYNRQPLNDSTVQHKDIYIRRVA